MAISLKVASNGKGRGYRVIVTEDVTGKSHSGVYYDGEDKTAFVAKLKAKVQDNAQETTRQELETELQAILETV
jgi:hypothetical protein